LHEQLPEVFGQHPMPGNWDSDWIVAPMWDPESPEREGAIGGWFEDDIPPDEMVSVAGPRVGSRYPWVPVVRERFPGGPIAHDWSASSVPPPDALAFYLPFHYYYPRHWGIYVTADGERWLARFLSEKSDGALSFKEGNFAARVFLYGHEAYHHIVESFGTRLETTHRRPLYKLGMEQFYQNTVGSDDCIEEALANVYGRDKAVKICVGKLKWPTTKINALKAALKIYFQMSGPGYRMAHTIWPGRRLRMRTRRSPRRIRGARSRRCPRSRRLFGALSLTRSVPLPTFAAGSSTLSIGTAPGVSAWSTSEWRRMPEVSPRHENFTSLPVEKLAFPLPTPGD
jgi:hypothetical protein